MKRSSSSKKDTRHRYESIDSNSRKSSQRQSKFPHTKELLYYNSDGYITKSKTGSVKGGGGWNSSGFSIHSNDSTHSFYSRHGRGGERQRINVVHVSTSSKTSNDSALCARMSLNSIE